MLKWIRLLLGAKPEARRTDAWMREAYGRHGKGDVEKAEALYRRILEEEPDNADALYLLGEIEREQGKLEEAIGLLERAIGANGGVAAFHFSLGNALQRQGDSGRAIECYRAALELAADSPETHYNLGLAQLAHGDCADAEASFRRALGFRPDFAEAHFSLGGALLQRGRHAEALEGFSSAIRIRPDWAAPYNNLGIALLELGRAGEAAGMLEAALRLDPSCAQAHLNLGNARLQAGRIVEAQASYRKALELDPGYAEAHSNLLLSLHYTLGDDAQAMYAEHLGWAARHAAAAETLRHDHDGNRERRLRIGYVSADFRRHAVAFFIEPLLLAHDRERFEIHCFSDCRYDDEVTLRLRGASEYWHDLRGMSDEQLARRVRELGIDILVDLAGHTAHNRLKMFAGKPAPVLVTYLGYPGTTGLKAMDYRITDVIADPVGLTEAFHSEHLVRLPHGFLCYLAPESVSIAPDPPAAGGKGVTFASFSNIAKLSDRTLQLWSAVLRRVPGSRLVLKGISFGDPAVEEAVRERFAQAAIPPERLELWQSQPAIADHLASYAGVDIALDTYPYNGTTTLCEALWMGVPVITLAGSTHVSRVGASILHQVGLEDLVVTTPEEFVERAAALGSAIARLRELRRGLRERMAASPLCDRSGFTRELEAAYLRMRAEIAFETETPAAAETWLRRALAEADPVAALQYKLGCVLQEQGKIEDAIASYQSALLRDSGMAKAHNNLGSLLQVKGDMAAAEACYRRALAADPGLAEAHNNLGLVQQEAFRYDEAEISYLNALAHRPDMGDAHNNLGDLYLRADRLEDAEQAFRRAFETDPRHSNLLFCLNYIPGHDRGEVFSLYRAWNAKHVLPRARPATHWANDPDPARRLRIAYFSADFCAHPVAYFFEPLLAHHDRTHFEVFCYSNTRSPDAVTERLRGLADGWREILGLDDEQVCDRVRRDGIDILVDLAGHTDLNRLMVLARKPAPVQVSYLGYPNTTGLDSVDYRLTDADADPPGPGERYYTEELVRLPSGFLCYQPGAAPEAAGPPALAAGHLTFGSFNNLSKVNTEVVAVWSEILRAVPGSRLLLKAKSLHDSGVRRRVLEWFVSRGIAEERIELRGTETTIDAHLRCYHRVDIALDPFPYNGTTTTCEALWMGVPVITLAGDWHAGRVGVSLLRRVGLEEWIADSTQDYVGKAVALAREPGRLLALRRELRQRMRGSPLCDGAGFARQVETAYRKMWRRWCETQLAGPCVPSPEVRGQEFV